MYGPKSLSRTNLNVWFCGTVACEMLKAENEKKRKSNESLMEGNEAICSLFDAYGGCR